ncbi:hypothetical protein ACFL0M_07570 [Thermodesulfobacteriota bacterium]
MIIKIFNILSACRSQAEIPPNGAAGSFIFNKRLFVSIQKVNDILGCRTEATQAMFGILFAAAKKVKQGAF